MITLRPYEDYAAWAVFRALDVHDHMEAEAVRGASATSLALFADWRVAQAHGLLSVVAHAGPAQRPFAVVTMGHTGQKGVAEAAMLACDHARHACALARLAIIMRRGLPRYATDSGITRIEARSWAAHPTAARLLTAIGFTHECDMPGFGRAGEAMFRQFAWNAPAPTAHPTPIAAAHATQPGESPCA
ncbi:hypothetical protein [Rhodoferax sp.]|uniref:hypothetical protein n=1 Tax=Rhodoferax sp. TaxID=50421 RepID=UPI002ACEB880|nr:hypothetical protein [Rhodoferax sp.]MDZ7919974.1 hypothetical protein [Rhodoferax sp.]